MAKLNYQQNIKLSNFYLCLKIWFCLIGDFVSTSEVPDDLIKLLPLLEDHENFEDYNQFRSMEYYETDYIDKSLYSGPGGIITDYVPVSIDAIPHITSRVIGGHPAEPGIFPYIVSLRHDFRHICGGTILAPTWILTAAHCVKQEEANQYRIKPNYDNFKNSRGNEREKIYSVGRIFIPDRRSQYADDVALLKLTEPIPLGGQFTSIRLPSRPPPDYVNQKVTVAGWGQMGHRSSSYLMTSDFPLRSESECREIFPKYFLDGMICAGIKGVDACPGDSGGPLVIKGSSPKEDVIVGVVSWGPPCGTSLGVYADVWYYSKWIKQNADLSEMDNSNKPPWSNQKSTEKFIPIRPPWAHVFRPWNPVAKTISRIFDKKKGSRNNDNHH